MNWRALTGTALFWGWSAFSDTVSTQSFYVGMCDASAAVALNNELFAVANDEDNSLRIYNAAKGGAPVYRHPRSGSIERKAANGQPLCLQCLICQITALSHGNTVRRNRFYSGRLMPE